MHDYLCYVSLGLLHIYVVSFPGFWFLFSQYYPRDWLGRASPKCPVLCWVGCNDLNSISQSAPNDGDIGLFVTVFWCQLMSGNVCLTLCTNVDVLQSLSWKTHLTAGVNYFIYMSGIALLFFLDSSIFCATYVAFIILFHISGHIFEHTSQSVLYYIMRWSCN